jgi:hypothetical protein
MFVRACEDAASNSARSWRLSRTLSTEEGIIRVPGLIGHRLYDVGEPLFKPSFRALQGGIKMNRLRIRRRLAEARRDATIDGIMVTGGVPILGGFETGIRISAGGTDAEIKNTHFSGPFSDTSLD